MENRQEYEHNCELLYEKMSNEQDTFIEKLKHSSPEEIISASYEKVMRDDILMIFEYESDLFDENQVKALLQLKYPLSACYDEWLKKDCSYMDMLRDTVDDFSRKLVQKNEAELKEMKDNEISEKKRGLDEVIAAAKIKAEEHNIGKKTENEQGIAK